MAVEDVLLVRWGQMKEEVSEEAKFNPYIWLTYFSAPTPDLDDTTYRELLAIYEILRAESRDPNNVYNKLYLLDDDVDDYIDDDP
jgi:hypothetical protein